MKIVRDIGEIIGSIAGIAHDVAKTVRDHAEIVWAFGGKGA